MVRTVRLTCAVIAAVAALGVSNLHAFESRPQRAFLYDMNTRTVLYAQGAEERFAPASLSKFVTAAVVQELLDGGVLELDDTFPMTEDAWRRGGAPSGRATMFAELGSDVPISALHAGVIVLTANDAAIALAQGIDGTEAAFSDRMNARASALGALDSNFTNATGADDAAMHTTVRDLVTMAIELLETEPRSVQLYAQPAMTWNDIFQRNRNPLFREIDGTDGFVAGYTESAGYGALGTVEREGRRIVYALSGVDTAEGRVAEAERLVEYAFSDFRTIRVANPGETVGSARIYGGEVRTVDLVADGGALDILLPREGEERVRARVVYDHPFPAPVEEGQPIARLLVERDGTIIQNTPLVAASSVSEGNVVQRARDGFFELLTGWIPPISFAGSL
ncbi:MAG: D-alanyl-D-alanine carboxypeptidase family protein [Pseudomonadota bacterium]